MLTLGEGDTDHMTDGEGLSRREALRRGALVAGATVWTTPVIQAMARPAFANGSPAGGGNCTGCLTGGGQVIENVSYQGTSAEVSFGLSPICCGEEPKPGTELEVNIHKVGDPASQDLSYHFNLALTLVCSIDHGCVADQPQYCANRFTGQIFDAEGNRLEFDFIDCGEPGHDVDKVSLKIYSPTNSLVVSALGLLSRGNLQAHEALGPLERVCDCA